MKSCPQNTQSCRSGVVGGAACITVRVYSTGAPPVHSPRPAHRHLCRGAVRPSVLLAAQQASVPDGILHTDHRGRLLVGSE
jgi:hypothetical protein